MRLKLRHLVLVHENVSLILADRSSKSQGLTLLYIRIKIPLTYENPMTYPRSNVRLTQLKP